MTTVTTVTCPVTGKEYTQRRKSFNDDVSAVSAPAVSSEQDPAGFTVWTLRSYETVKQLLKTGYSATQAGFDAELNRELKFLRPSVLIQDGEVHRKQRSAIAKFFTPKAVQDNYVEFMNTFSQKIIDGIQPQKVFDLGEISMSLAVQVAAQVVGLTDSFPGMNYRLNELLGTRSVENLPRFQRWSSHLNSQVRLFLFYLNDVRPAIQVRKKRQVDGEFNDVIEYLLQQDYKHIDIVMECLTYGAAGMITTREFITMVTWHMLHNDTLRQQYLQAEQKERHTILHEILRLEPVVTKLARRAVEDITIQDGEHSHQIKAGDLVKLDLATANIDTNAIGEKPLDVCPHRERSKGVQPPVLAFGDGPHRCPGAFIAIAESDVFLQKFLALPLEIMAEPTITWNALISSYEITGLTLRLNA